MAPPLYYLDCYTKEFDATIIENPSPTSVTIDTLGFYPTGGGQPHDTGKLITAEGSQFNVLSVIKLNNQIIHELDAPAPHPGTKVHCIIDWNRRYGHMRYHTSCHVLCAIIHAQCKAKITGNQIGLDHTRIDFNLEGYDRALLEGAITKANEIIKKGLQITLSVITPKEASAIADLVKLEEDRSSTLTAVRVVSIQDIDTQACGGTHLKNTSEIGTIILEKVENKGKNNRRVYFTIDPAPHQPSLTV